MALHPPEINVTQLFLQNCNMYDISISRFYITEHPTLYGNIFGTYPMSGIVGSQTKTSNDCTTYYPEFITADLIPSRITVVMCIRFLDSIHYHGNYLRMAPR